MTEPVSEVVLRGGSLNRTSLRRFADGSAVVRKSVSRTANREYGFVRWCSQFKRLQRYERLLPGLFPHVYGVGIDAETIHLDMEFIAGSVDVKTYLSAFRSDAEIERLHGRLWGALDRMHEHTAFDTYPGSLAAYFGEEVEQRLSDALRNAEFRGFCEHDAVVVNGASVTGLLQNLDWFRRRFEQASLDRECFTHGNVTLENVLYAPEQGRIVFIDPYEENIVDCREAEYSQVLQCSNQGYGYINDRQVQIAGNAVSFSQEIPQAFGDFNKRFLDELNRRLSDAQMALVRLFEASQFTRMLPFKVLAGDIDKAKYFYGVASLLAAKLKADLE